MAPETVTTTTLIIAVLGSSGLFSLITGIVTSLMFRSKTKAETKKSMAETDNLVGITYKDLVEEMRTEVKRLQVRIDDLQLQLNSCLAENLVQMNRLRERIRRCEASHPPFANDDHPAPTEITAPATITTKTTVS